MEHGTLGSRDPLFKFVVKSHPDPEPQDEERETQILNSIIDYCVSPEWHPDDALPGVFEPTPWVTWQLGTYAELASSEKRHEIAWRVAMASVKAAFRIRSPERIYANMLTLGNVRLAAGDLDNAELAYRKLLQLPIAQEWQQKGMARLNLGMVLRKKGERRPGAWQSERGLAWIGQLLKPEDRSVILQGLAQVYTEIRDFAGLLCTASVLAPKEKFESMLAQFQFPNIDMAMSTVTRCKVFGDPQLAQRMRALWKIKGEKDD